MSIAAPVALTPEFAQAERYARLLDQDVRFSLPVLAADQNREFWNTPIIAQLLARLNDDDLLSVLTHRAFHLHDGGAAKVLDGLYDDKVVDIANGAGHLYFDDLFDGDFTHQDGRDEAVKWRAVAALLKNDVTAPLPAYIKEPAPLRYAG